MDRLYGLRIVFRPEVPVGRAIVHRERGVIAFRDRYSLHTALFWARLSPILDRLAGEAIVAFRRAASGKEPHTMIAREDRCYAPLAPVLHQCRRCQRLVPHAEAARDDDGEYVCRDRDGCARRRALSTPDGR